MRILNKIVPIFMVIFLFIFIMLSNLQYMAFNSDFYYMEFSKYNITNVTGMDKYQLSKVATRIQDYLSGKVDSLQTNAVIYGQNQNVFNERELKHMKDVRELFKRGFFIKNIVIFLFVLSIFFLYFSKKDTFNIIYHGMLWIIGIIIVATIIVSLDFNRWFTYFHLIFFNNDLWELDITKDRLIQMLPEGFFSDISYFTIRNSVIVFLIIGFISYLLKNKDDKK
ncbi:TIGR01906 family membrane protein [Thermoanaerobacterium sp. RBIITD]|uniref:TIGR01906 family membrane protein n=1 Tax=Thermoanaerobacterium sp. RBIITD TaxID=1550240 RepID=UPI000BB8C4BB|nr:TIGR01906 family membrane protein [Thermoanaerobacterium sp. RBIITD]SNX54574.1 integral membrane protein TIGR01906 [Thermoanaerobacterium sp. RBIITD]